MIFVIVQEAITPTVSFLRPALPTHQSYPRADQTGHHQAHRTAHRAGRQEEKSCRRPAHQAHEGPTSFLYLRHAVADRGTWGQIARSHLHRRSAAARQAHVRQAYHMGRPASPCLVGGSFARSSSSLRCPRGCRQAPNLRRHIVGPQAAVAHWRTCRWPRLCWSATRTTGHPREPRAAPPVAARWGLLPPSRPRRPCLHDCFP